jgi:type VI secretion system protein ImpC
MKSGPPSTQTSSDKLSFAYPINRGGSVEFKQQPFIIGVLADLSGDTLSSQSGAIHRHFIDITPSTFDDVFRRLSPSICVDIPNILSDTLEERVFRFTSIGDFEPRALVRTAQPFVDLMLCREALANGLQSPSYHDLTPSLLVQQAGLATMCPVALWFRREFERLCAAEAIPNPYQELLHCIDGTITLLLDSILHAPLFSRLHASWLGLQSLVQASESLPSCKIRIFNVNKKDLRPSADTAWKGIVRSVQEAYQTLGGLPFTALIIDHEIHGDTDLNILAALADLASEAFFAVIASADAGMFPTFSFQTINTPELFQFFAPFQKFPNWKRFRSEERARHVFLTVPRIMVRTPYRIPFPNGHTADPAVNANHYLYTETVQTDTRAGFLWGTSVYALATRLAASVATFGWVPTISPEVVPGMIMNMPIYTGPDKQPITVGPPDIAITRAARDRLLKLGFTPLIQCRASSDTAFFGTTSCYKEGARDLVLILIASQFQHYFTALMRESPLATLPLSDFRKELTKLLQRFQQDENTRATQHVPLRGIVLGSKDHDLDADPSTLQIQLTVVFPDPVECFTETLTIDLRPNPTDDRQHQHNTGRSLAFASTIRVGRTHGNIKQ